MKEILFLIISLCIFYLLFKIFAVIGEFTIKVFIGFLIVYLVLYSIYKLIKFFTNRKKEKKPVIKIYKIEE